uniref:proline--tRNA ligase n=1 Tax=Amphimedon queenslandica TaxID=400682 RepID=A0A1X7SPS0_AMPQE
MGARVLHKLVSVIDQEMRSVGACKMSAPILAPAYIWKQSGRWESIGAELYRLEDRHEAQFCLGPTHEEMFTHLVATENISYRSLPLRLYQIDRKFRDEMSPQSGLMRAKEFWMKVAPKSDKSPCAKHKKF